MFSLKNPVAVHIHSQGCTGCTCTPKAKKNLGPNLKGKVISAPPGRECTPEVEQEYIFKEIGRSGRWERLLGVFLACVLRMMTKKVVNFFGEEKCTPIQNPGYAYVAVCGHGVLKC